MGRKSKNFWSGYENDLINNFLYLWLWIQVKIIWLLENLWINYLNTTTHFFYFFVFTYNIFPLYQFIFIDYIFLNFIQNLINYIFKDFIDLFSTNTTRFFINYALRISKFLSRFLRNLSAILQVLFITHKNNGQFFSTYF